jgi:hypothetical protein
MTIPSLRRIFRPTPLPAEVAGDPPAGTSATALTKSDRENLDRAAALQRVNLAEHNAGGRPPGFGRVVSQATSAAQFTHPDYHGWADVLGEPDVSRRFNRKIWEWAYILQAARQSGVLEAGRRAVGFGVGNEPVPAVLARHGLFVIATDQVADAGDEGTDGDAGWQATGQWAQTGQLLSGIEGLRRPEIVPDETLADLVRTRRVDMNAVPDDLGPCDLTWSSCALEHLGSPEHGLRFVRRTASLLAPGGVAVHTTELELTERSITADYGHLACYRPADLRALADDLIADGFEIELNFHVPVDSPEDRWISVVLLHGPELAAGELSHLKVTIGDSVITSFGLLIRRPTD